MTLSLLALLLLLLAVSSVAALSTDDLSNVRLIGTGMSQANLTKTETTLFKHTLGAGSVHGVLNHFWAAGNPCGVDSTLVRYYIDGEAVPSLAFTPAEAAGVGFGDQATFQTKWFGKGAKSTGWFNNFQVPFGRSVRVTFQSQADCAATIWLIVRGAENLPIRVGNLELPPTARLQLQKQTVELEPLAFVDLASVPTGSHGLFFMSSVAINSSANLNFMEGCFHFYSPPTQPWPGVLLSTGMEDYYDSAFYFDGGPFTAPVSGVTHLDKGAMQFSGYRFHEMDVVVFHDGMRFQWRNGDVTDTTTGLKCTLEAASGPNVRVAGNPQASTVSVSAWIYTW